MLDPLYDAAVDPAAWHHFLEQASRMFDAEKAAMMVHVKGTAGTAVCAEVGFGEEMRRAAEALPGPSPWMAEIRKCEKQGWYCGTPEDVMPLAKFRRSRLYNEVLHRYDVEWPAAAVIFRPGEYLPVFVLGRSRSSRPFSVEDKLTLRQLVPHLNRVFKVQTAVNGLRERNAAGQHALDLMGAACLTLDPSGRVISMNRRAEALIQESNWLRLRDRRLLTVVSQQQKYLDECLLQACACGEGQVDDPGEGAVVLQSAQGRSLYVSALPYHGNWLALEGRPSAVVFITPPEEQGQGEHRLWQTMFGLSPAECRVAEAMKQGLEVVEISDSMRIKMDTVRYYQKCLYRKTGVRGQGNLLRLLARLPSSCPE